MRPICKGVAEEGKCDCCGATCPKRRIALDFDGDIRLYGVVCAGLSLGWKGSAPKVLSRAISEHWQQVIEQAFRDVRSAVAEYHASVRLCPAWANANPNDISMIPERRVIDMDARSPEFGILPAYRAWREALAHQTRVHREAANGRSRGIPPAA
jgi:hypothetical protein